MKINALVVAALSSLILSSQLAAGAQVCLQRNRLQSWRVINQNTLEMTDRSRKVYHVTLRDGCPNVTRSTATLVFGRSWGNLQCLGPGLAINVTAHGHGLRTCRVGSVTAG
jgi:hypothetical protein